MNIRPIVSSMLRNKTAPLLIAAQVALTLAILCNALYLIHDRLATASRPSGADEPNLFAISFYPHRPIADVRDLQRRDIEALRAIPGVVSAAWANQMPLGQSGWNWGGLRANPESGDSTIQASYYFSGDALVETLGLRLVEGRDFTPDEVTELDPERESKNPNRMIITTALARQLFPGESSFVGKTFYLGSGNDADPVQIVGVVDRLQSPSAPAGAQAENSMIAPVRFLNGFRYVVRAEPGARDRAMVEAEKALVALSHDRVLLGNRGFDEIRANRYSGEMLMAALLIAVTGFLLLITASGIVGMASLWVNQRTKQIGVRRALGARRAQILRDFLVENALITAGGAIVGLALALLLNDVLVRELEVARLPLAYLGIGVVVMAVLGQLAVLAPAARAAAVPPAVATRTV